MEINRSENEIVIKISKNNYLYSKLDEMEDIKQFVEYVFELQETVNGIDSGEYPCFKPIDEYKLEMEKFNKDKIEEEKDICMNTIAGCLNEILDVSMGHCCSFKNPDGLISIDCTDNLMMVGLFYERLIHLIGRKRFIEMVENAGKKVIEKYKNRKEDRKNEGC